MAKPVVRKPPPKTFFVDLLAMPAFRYAMAVLAGLFLICLIIFSYFWVTHSRMIDETLARGPYTTTSRIYASPKSIHVGDQTTTQEILGQVRNAGYGESKTNRMGWYNVRPGAIEIFPGPDSFFENDGAVIKIDQGKVKEIISLRDNTPRNIYQLEPELLTNIFDQKREKRRVVRYEDIPKVLVDATISAEDKRFFQHTGFDPLRIVKAAYVDIRSGRHSEGASTISMQVARNMFLTREKTWKRKISETLITIQLEWKLTKEEIFAYYANQVADMGHLGSFGIRGFAEASQTYFGKDIRELTLPEAATLAGMNQRPSYTNPFTYPDRAMKRRNIILSMMRENGYINDHDYAQASAAPMKVVRGNSGSSDSAYFIDIVNMELEKQFSEHDFTNSVYRIHTTLDMDLQKDAAEAIRLGLMEVDKVVDKRKKKNPGPPQVALVVMDAQTGEIKALIGGRNYATSQLNHALAKRQPSSIFKPFVYAAALNTALQSAPNQLFTTSSMIVDEPTTFWYDGKPYEPSNYHQASYGTVTLRQALARSMNIPAVKLAQSVGYGSVAQLAKQAGMGSTVRGTPSVALGSYEVTPIEAAGAYSVFANHGQFSKPYWIQTIRDAKGQQLFEGKPIHKQVLDSRVNYLMVNLMEEVLRSGTGAGVRARGFGLPAAGKTGTGQDGWFAGFTTKLICVVWVGFDDNASLDLDGSQSALPIWTEFMKRAHQHREYRGVSYFNAPDGIVTVNIDPATGQLATDSCPIRISEVFITGSQPLETCTLHGGSRAVAQVSSWDTPDQVQRDVAAVVPKTSRKTVKVTQQPEASEKAPQTDEAPKEHKGLFGRIKDIFK